MHFEIIKNSTIRISFQYPSNWENNIEGNETYLFFNENYGSFRFTPVLIETTTFQIDKFLNDEYSEKKSLQPQWEDYNGLKFLHYLEESEGDENTIIHYFISGISSLLLVCSYAYDLSLHRTHKINEEILKVKEILQTIKFININKNG